MQKKTKIHTSLNSDLSEVNDNLSGKAPTSHASGDATYGLGNHSVYGHVRTIQDLTHSDTSREGLALGAAQGYILNQSITSVSNRVSNVETNLSSGSYNASNGHTHSQYLTSHQDLSSINNRLNTLEGNFNTALTSLYNACVDKGSTPTSQTISAIVTAVQNISTGVDLSDLGLSKEIIIEMVGVDGGSGNLAYTTYNNQSVLTGTTTSFNWNTSALITKIPDTYQGKPVILG